MYDLLSQLVSGDGKLPASLCVFELRFFCCYYGGYIFARPYAWKGVTKTPGSPNFGRNEFLYPLECARKIPTPGKISRSPSHRDGEKRKHPILFWTRNIYFN
eukprot:GEMP01168355.1.p2 GENE.GEMP01168355.1~~GEMP01168355.1.p2  ORF type:complete len:102 (-),score=0.18 GEMP01168355.1:21-326(-)